MAEAELTQIPAAENTPVQKFIENLKQLNSQQKIGLGVGIAALLALILSIWLWQDEPDYRVLYGNLSHEDGGEIIDALQQANIPYQLSSTGGALMVPSAQVHEIRLTLAAQGLPKGGNSGFEIMENQKFGTTQFAERVNYQRALEGELARSVQTVAAVRSARVHLAIPKPTVFVKEKQSPTASVVLNLRGGRILDKTQVRAIVHLISSSIPDLAPSNITVVDQDGNLLSEQPDADERDELNSKQLNYVREIEKNYIERVESLLKPLFGSQNIRAQVTAEVDFARTEQTAEIYKPNRDPTESSVRSEQKNYSLNGENLYPNGVPGALTNQPPAPPTAPIVSGGNPDGRAVEDIQPGSINALKNGQTVNYEVDRTIRHTILPIGMLKRLSVAVVVNGDRSITDEKGKSVKKPVSPEEEAKLNQLVKDAVGFDQQRGDNLSVQVINFNEVITEEESNQYQQYVEQILTPDFILEALKYLGIILVMLLIIFKIIKPALQPLFPKEEEKEKEEEETDEEKEARNMEESLQQEADQSPAAIFEASRKEPSYKENMEAAKQIAQQDPKIVASVIKDWVNE